MTGDEGEVGVGVVRIMRGERGVDGDTSERRE